MHSAVKDIKHLWNGNQMSNNIFILNGNMRTLSKHNTGTYFSKHNYTNNNLLFSSEEETVRSASCFFSPVIIGTHCSRFLKSWWVVRLHLSWVGVLISPGTDFAAFHAASPSVLCSASHPSLHASHNFFPHSLHLLAVPLSLLLAVLPTVFLPVFSPHLFLLCASCSSQLQHFR